jgi:hypothetical protein
MKVTLEGQMKVQTSTGFGGVIEGKGSLSISDTAQVTVAGRNTFTGTTFVAAETRLMIAGTHGSGPIQVAGNLDFRRTNEDAQFDPIPNKFSGAGMVTFSPGSGFIGDYVITGNSSMDGQLKITSSTVVTFGNGGTTGVVDSKLIVVDGSLVLIAPTP